MQSSISNERKPVNMILSAAVVMLLCIVFGFWLTQQVDRSKAEAISSSTIIQQIRDASELTTTVLTVERVTPVVSDKEGAFWTRGKLLYVASGNVRVGIKLDDLRSEDVLVEDKTVTVNLPPLRILSSSIDVKHSYVYAYDEDVFGLAPTDETLQQKAKHSPKLNQPPALIG
ncbi:MAG TPA: DUF4230 domain-containing protein [Thermosynechococcaceae cyanobacterium]